MSSVRSGSAIRSSSRRPAASNRHSSTFVALAENRAKFVPRPSHVAPSGCGTPRVRRGLAVRDKKEGSKRRKDKGKLRAVRRDNRRDCPGVPNVAAAIDGSVGIEHLTPAPGEWHAHPLVRAHFRREIGHHEAPVSRLSAFTQPGKDTSIDVVRYNPLE